MRAIFLVILAITLARGQDDHSGEDRPLGGILGGHEGDDKDPSGPPLGGIVGGHESEGHDRNQDKPLGGIVGGHESEGHNKTQDQPLGGILGSSHGNKVNGNKARRPLGGLEG